MTYTIWVDPDGNEYTSLPKNWHGKVSPLTESYALSHGWKKEEREIADAPRVYIYSKYKIYLRLRALGLWERVKQAMQDMGVWESWQTIVEIESDNEELIAALPIIRELLPDIDVDAELANCTKDGE